MSGGVIQLVAYGNQDIFLTTNPQITFFKVVYRRHTNFSTEMITQTFADNADFGKRVTTVLSRDGDLIRNIYLVVVLPAIPQFFDEFGDVDQISKFAWVRRIGYGIINSIEIEIGDELIDKQYGDWMNIWNDLTVTTYNNIDKILGDVKELTDFSNGKSSYELYIPLKFWFNRITGLALPIVSLQYSSIRINVELNNFDQCYVVTPTHVIPIDNDFVNFDDYEYIQQNVNGVISLARFIYFDISNRDLYIWRLSDNGFLSFTQTVTGTLTELQQHNILYPPTDLLANQQYFITGLTSKFNAMPQINAVETPYSNTSINFNNISLQDAYLLVEYIYLDDEERVRFSQSKLEYLIEQVLFTGQQTINGINQSFNLGYTQPCKELVWVTQLSVAQETRVNDLFNYTNSLIRNTSGELIGTNLILNETIYFNGQERLSYRDSSYFSWAQPYQHHTNGVPEGVNVYSFSLFPENHQPSGVANLSRLDNITLKINVNPLISFTYTAALRVYCVVYNILRVANGISGLVFSMDIKR